MWNCKLKVIVDGGKAFEVIEGFFRQIACPKGSMVQGYIVYQSMVYISQYLPNLAKNINLPRIWHVYSIHKFEGEVLSGKGRKRKVKGNENGVHFIYYTINFLIYVIFIIPSVF